MGYYYSDNGRQRGPIDADRLTAAGVGPDALVWREGMAEWQPAGSVAELARWFPPAVVAPPVPDLFYPPNSARPVSPYGPPRGQAVEAGHGAAPPLGYSGGYGAGSSAVPPPNGLCIASLVLGILAVPALCANGIGGLLAVVAIVLGHVGQSQYRRATGRRNGLAAAGLACGYGVLAVLAGLILFAAIWFGSM